MMMHRVLSFLALASLALGASAQTFPSEEVDAYVLEQMEQQEVSGVAIAVTSAGRLVYAKGYGMADLHANRPVTSKTKFEIGSLADLFISMAALKLVEQQKLSLESHVSESLGAAAPPSWKAIKLRNVLGHTSGLSDVLESDKLDVLGASSSDELMKVAAAMAFKAEPGETWDYSSTNPLVASMVVGKVGGSPWSDQADALFWKPAGMTSTGPAKEGDLLLAVGYSHSDAGWVKTEASSLHLRIALGGGVASTVEDWARFDLAFGRESLLAKPSWSLLKGPEPVKKGNNPRGLGLESGKLDDGTPWVGCMGFGDGFSGQYMRFEGLKTSVVVFCNTEGVDCQQIGAGILEVIQAAASDGG